MDPSQNETAKKAKSVSDQNEDQFPGAAGPISRELNSTSLYGPSTPRLSQLALLASMMDRATPNLLVPSTLEPTIPGGIMNSIESEPQSPSRTSRSTPISSDSDTEDEKWSEGAGKKRKEAPTITEQMERKQRRPHPPNIEDLKPITVDIMVHETKFKVHKELVCYHSDYFDAAFNGPFQEGMTQTIADPDITQKAFALFVRWIYSRNIPGISSKIDEHSTGDILELALLADAFFIPELQNLALRHAFTRARTRKTHHWHMHVNNVYNRTVPSSPIRKLVVDLVAFTLKPESRECLLEGDGFPTQFMVDIALALDYREGEKVVWKNLNVDDYMVEVPEDWEIALSPKRIKSEED